MTLHKSVFQVDVLSVSFIFNFSFFMFHTQRKDLQRQANTTMEEKSPGITLEMIHAEANQLLGRLEWKSGSPEMHSTGLLKHNTANNWIEQARKRPKPRMLFDEFWFEGELCILYADTNLGKSILAMQIGDSISKGECIKGFRLEANKQKILYFDFEMSDKQFENRYSIDYEQHYTFDDNFGRVEIDPDSMVPDNQSFEDFLNDSVEKLVIETGARILIIDNLTYLKNETEKAGNALPLMKHLKALKSKYNLSILALAHTPKRDLSKPISPNDLQGSKALMSFTDSSFTIGESQRDKNIRYIKQMKVRQNEFIYDANNVAVFLMHKPANFLHFELIDFGSEKEHLREPSEKDREQKIADIQDLRRQGLSNVQIAKRMGVTEGTIRKLIKKDIAPT